MNYTQASNFIDSVTDNLNDKGAHAWCGFTTVALSSILSMKPQDLEDYQKFLKARIDNFNQRGQEPEFGYFRKK